MGEREGKQVVRDDRAGVGPVALMNKDPGEIEAALKSSAYADEKRTLAAQKRFSFLEPFAGDLIVDRIVFDVTDRLKSEIPPYDPFQLESLATSAGQLLDRCLANRREMYDIEEQAVRRALEYKLFADQRGHQRDIELAAHVEAQRQVEAIGQTKAAAEFRKTAGALNQGFGDIAEATAKSSALAEVGERTRKSDVNEKWAALERHQRALEACHTTPGSSLHYAERFGRLELIFRQDVRVAYQKLRCVDAAVRHLFGITEPKLPKPTPYGYLDRMVVHLRDLLEQAGIITQDEVEFDRVISLRQPMGPRADGEGKRPLIADEMWTALMKAEGSGRVEVDLRDQFPGGIRSIRLRGVGLSLLFNEGDRDLRDEVLHPRSVAGLLFPPPVPDLFSPRQGKITKPPVVMSWVTWTDPYQPRMVSPAHILNLDPRDKWSVQIGSNVLFNYLLAMGRETMVLDVRLHFRCAALLDAGAAWKDFTW